MLTFFIIIHVFLALLLLLVILLSVSRGATGSSFLGGSSDSLILGPAGDVFLKKVVIVLSIAFVITSITISVLIKRRGIKFHAGHPGGQTAPAVAQQSAPAAAQQKTGK